MDILQDFPAQNLLQKAGNFSHWHHFETHLLQSLVLYKWGGPHMDADVILVHPVDSLL